MFSSKAKLDKRTPEEGINREDYIALLADEYRDSNNSEAKEQVTANLANFAYDPINFKFLKKAKVVDIFLEIITSVNNRLVLHGIAGICNICLDEDVRNYIIKYEGLRSIAKLLSHSDPDIVINTITTLIHLITEETRDKILQHINFEHITKLSQSSNDLRLRNLAQLFLTDYSSR